MVQPIPPNPADRPQDAATYQPLAGLAVVAVSVAVLFAVVVGVLGLIAVLARKPAVVPTLLIVPVMAVILSVLARVQVDRAEGTRAGRGLASFAWWVAVVSGACYGAYVVAFDLAIAQQSKDFGDKFFRALRDGDVNQAFYMTIDPARRQGVSPKDAGALEASFGERYYAFRSSEVVRLLARSGADLSVESLGQTGWQQEPTGFLVSHKYRFDSPEGAGEVALLLTAVEGRDGSARQWYVSLNTGGIGLTSVTRYGKALLEIQARAAGFVQSFIGLNLSKQMGAAYALTLTPEQMRDLETRALAQSLVATPASLSLVRLPPPGLASFPKSGFFRTESGGEPSEEQRQIFFEKIWANGACLRPGSSGGGAGPASQAQPEVRQEPGGVRAIAGLELAFFKSSTFARAEAHVVAGLPELAKRLDELREEGKRPDRAYARPDQVVLGDLYIPWRLAEIRSDLAQIAVQKGPDGMPSPAGR